MVLAIHTFCQPISENEPVYGDGCLSLSRLVEEGTLAKSAAILGWRINTRTLLLLLTSDKFNSWQLYIKKILENKKTSNEELFTTTLSPTVQEEKQKGNGQERCLGGVNTSQHP
jgi:hypothetical protein